MKLTTTKEDQETIARAFRGFDAKVAETFVFLRDPMNLTEEDMEQISSYLHHRFETLALVMLTLRGIAGLVKERGFGSDTKLAELSTQPPDELGELFGSGQSNEGFERISDRATVIAEARRTPNRQKINELMTRAAMEGGHERFEDRYKELLAENGLLEAERALDDEMYSALWQMEKWFLSRLEEEGAKVDA